MPALPRPLTQPLPPETPEESPTGVRLSDPLDHTRGSHAHAHHHHRLDRLRLPRHIRVLRQHPRPGGRLLTLGEQSGQSKSGAAKASTPLSSAVLAERLLAEADLGQDYTRKPGSAARHDDVTVIGCPALEQLGGDAATGGSLDFPNKAKVTFVYSGSTGSEVAEELYSDAAPKLADGTRQIFDAMTGCPVYQVVIGSRPVKITTQKLAAPPWATRRGASCSPSPPAGRTASSSRPPSAPGPSC